MSDIIDIAEERRRRESPDAEHVRRGDDGRLYYRFGCEYEFDGNTWTFDVWALDVADAEARIAAIRAGGRVSGQIHATVPG
jgi:hypothetical protein